MPRDRILEQRSPCGPLIIFGLLSSLWATPIPAATTDVRRDHVVEAVETAMPSVVNIAAVVVEYRDLWEQSFREYFGWGPATPRDRPNSIGSGVIIDEDGWVLTSFHVVRDPTQIEVKLWDGRVYKADPIVYTPFSDIALLKLRAPPDVRFEAISFAADDDLLLGETVLALGNPFGLGGSVSRGILSSKNRRPIASESSLAFEDWLQTDAAINPGNSGGPLINLHGELIGLNVAVIQQAQGLGFAVPVKRVGEALSQFFTPEWGNSLWFGVRVKVGSDPPMVSAVQPGSPAEQVGLKKGQRIVLVNGEKPGGFIGLNDMLCRAPDHRVALEVLEDEKRREVTVALVPFDDLIWQKLGLALEKLSTQSDTRYRVRRGEGLYITRIEDEGPADRARLRQGFVVVGADGREMRDVKNLALLLSAAQPGQQVRLTMIEPRRLGAGFVEYRRRSVPVQVR